MVDSAIYEIHFTATETAGNRIIPYIINSFTFDTLAPTFSQLGPDSLDFINNSMVSYKISEALSSGQVKWTNITPGSENTVSIIDLAGDELTVGYAEIGSIEMIDLLINKGADIHHQNKQGTTAAMKSVEKNHYYVLKILLSNNVDLNQSDYTGRTIKDIARNSRDKRIIKLLN